MVAGAIAEARPERIGLLTLVGESWAERRGRARRFAYRIRAAGYRWEWAWHIEPNPKGTGHHVQYVQHGSRVPVEAVRGAAVREGLGSWVGLHAVRNVDAAAFYGLKLAASAYGLKLAREQETLRVYLEANGGRLVHTSRSFWRDGDGRTFRGRKPQRAAIENALRMAHGERSGSWVLEHESTIDRGCRYGARAATSSRAAPATTDAG